jgi:hypothetical protein
MLKTQKMKKHKMKKLHLDQNLGLIQNLSCHGQHPVNVYFGNQCIATIEEGDLCFTRVFFVNKPIYFESRTKFFLGYDFIEFEDPELINHRITDRLNQVRVKRKEDNCTQTQMCPNGCIHLFSETFMTVFCIAVGVCCLLLSVMCCVSQKF